MDNHQDILLDVENLHTGYRLQGKFYDAVDGVDFTLKRNEVLAIVGESGCGKSTIASSIVGLYDRKNTRVTGDIKYKNLNLVSLTDGLFDQIRGNDIGMIFQDPMSSLNPLMKVGDQVAESLLYHTKMNKGQRRARVIELFKEVGMPKPETMYDMYPHELSGGLRQRVVIAMAVACKPEIIIADEPTTALDVTIQAQILELMKELQKDFGMSILFITHDLGTVARMCDRVAVMYLGKIVETAPAVEIFKNPQHPYTRGLIGSVHKIGTKGQDKLFSIEGTVPVAMNLPKRCGFYDRCDKRIEGVCDKCDPELINSGENHKVACFACTGCPQADKCGAEGGKA